MSEAVAFCARRIFDGEAWHEDAALIVRGDAVEAIIPRGKLPAGAQTIEKVYMPLKTKQTQMLGNGDAKAGAAELVEKLKTEVRVL